MTLKPIPKALGMNPAHWLRFTFMSKQVWLDERRSHAGFKPHLSAMGRTK